MNKRSRKQTHCGEFVEWGRRLVITRNRKDGFDEFFDAFVEEAVEANGCFGWGGGKEENLDVIIDLGCLSCGPAARFGKITAWLAKRPDVWRWRTSKEFDLWHQDLQIARSWTSQRNRLVVDRSVAANNKTPL
jgi:uncharacterized protein YggL (DUF469 family)